MPRKGVDADRSETRSGKGQGERFSPPAPAASQARVESPEGQSPFGPSAAETNPLASGEALTPRERSDRQQGAKRSAGGTAVP